MRIQSTTPVTNAAVTEGIRPHAPIPALFLLAGVCVSNAAADPVVWEIADGGNGHAYEAVAASVSWSEADMAAGAAGGHLATIQSAEENRFVFDLVDADVYWKAFNSGYYWGPWLGGYQRAGAEEPAGGWEWVTGEPFEYANWHPGEPSNLTSAGYQENVLHFFAKPGGTRASTWNDFYDHTSLRLNGYVIEYVPEPSVFLLLGIVGAFLTGRRTRSRHFQQANTNE